MSTLLIVGLAAVTGSLLFILGWKCGSAFARAESDFNTYEDGFRDGRYCERARQREPVATSHWPQ